MDNKPLINALRSSGNTEMKPSPRSGFVGALADALRGAQTGLNKVDLPYVGGLGDLMLGGAPKMADDISYQGLSALVRGGNAATGGIGTYGLKPETVDLAGVMTGLGGLAKPAVNAAGRAALPVAREFVGQVGARNMSHLPMAKKQLGQINTFKGKSGEATYYIDQEQGDWVYDPATGEEEWVGDPVAIIDGLFVPEKDRGKGYASEVMQQTIKKIRDENPGIEIRLSANPLDDKTDLDRLVGFYEKLGFRQIRDTGYYEGVPMSLKP